MVRIRIHSRESPAILVCSSVRDWTRFCYVIGLENIRIRCPHVIGFAADFKISGFDAAGCLWKGAVSGKNLWVQNIRIRVDGGQVYIEI